jgi:DNA/RNA endonuclease G (NUC1)
MMVIGEIDLTDNRNVAAGMPEDRDGGRSTAGNVIVSRKQYVVAFDGKAKVPVWTAWQLLEHDVGSMDRSEAFKGDEILNTFMEVNNNAPGLIPSDYDNTCFDRGHQTPSGDRSNDDADNKATYFMSNMAPQTMFLNRVIWKDFEQFNRNMVKNEHRKLQIFSGTILKRGRAKIGRNKDIDVPDSFFKISLVYENKTATTPLGYVAVLMPNVTTEGLDPIENHRRTCFEQNNFTTGKKPNKWPAYRKTIAEIEAKSGLNFPMLAKMKELKIPEYK